MVDAERDPKSAAEMMFSSLLAESPHLWNVADRFVRTLPDRMDALQEALREQSFGLLQALARDLKLAGSCHRCDLIASRAAAIEQAAHDHLLDDLTARIADLTALTGRIQAQLKTSDE